MARYGDLFGDAGYEYRNNFQDRRISPFNERENDLIYTSIVIDMIDDCNERDMLCNVFNQGFDSLEFPNDNVEYYTIKQIEDGLKGARSWNAWRDNMKEISNSTSSQIDLLFSNWY